MAIDVERKVVVTRIFPKDPTLNSMMLWSEPQDINTFSTCHIPLWQFTYCLKIKDKDGFVIYISDQMEAPRLCVIDPQGKPLQSGTVFTPWAATSAAACKAHCINNILSRTLAAYSLELIYTWFEYEVSEVPYLKEQW